MVQLVQCPLIVFGGSIEPFLIPQPVFHNWCNNDHGMYYPVCGMVCVCVCVYIYIYIYIYILNKKRNFRLVYIVFVVLKNSLCNEII